MTVVQSKLKSGKLTLGGTSGVGGVEFACQATNVRVVPEHNEDGDEVETLCGDTLAPDTKTTWSLQGTSIQDFDSPDGFIQYTWENNLEDVEFTWQPNAATTKFTGIVNIRALEVGGDVNTRITSDFEFPIVGDVTATWPAPGATTTDTEPEPDAEPEPEPEPEPDDDTIQVYEPV